MVTFEDNVLNGGFGSAVLEELNQLSITLPLLRIGWPDQFVEHGSSVSSLRAANGLDDESILGRIDNKLSKTLGNPVPRPYSNLH